MIHTPPVPSSAPHPCKHEADFGILNTAVLEIKDTLRDLKDLLAASAVLEERAEQFRRAITSIETRLRGVEVEMALGKGSSRWMERVVWFVVSGALGALLATVVKG